MHWFRWRSLEACFESAVTVWVVGMFVVEMQRQPGLHVHKDT